MTRIFIEQFSEQHRGVTPSKSGHVSIFHERDLANTPRYLPQGARVVPTGPISPSTASSLTMRSNDTTSINSERLKLAEVKNHTHNRPGPPPLLTNHENKPAYTVVLHPNAYTLVSPAELPLRPDALNETFKKGLKEITVLREQIAGQRILLKNERRDSNFQRGHLVVLEGDFMTAASNLVKFAPNIRAETSLNPSLFVVWDHLQQAYNRVTQLEQRWQSRERDLETLERRLFEKEVQFYGGEIDPLPPPGVEIRSRHYDDLDAVSACTVSTNPLEAQYYDRIGDIHLVRERLFNFEAEYRRQIGVRDSHRKGGGHELDPPDSVFFEKYFQQRLEIIREYSAADRDVQNLKVACQDLGLEIEEPNLPPFDESYALDQSRRDRDQRSIAYLKSSSLDDRYGIENKARVAVWLSAMQKEDPLDLVLSAARGLTPIGDLSTHLSVPLFEDNASIRQRTKTPSLFPGDSHLQTVLTAQDDSEMGNDANGAESTHPLLFRDPPKRRYSEPLLSAARMSHGTVDFAEPSRSGREAKTSKSVH